MNVNSNNNGVSHMSATPYLADVRDQPEALANVLATSRSIAAVPEEVGLAKRPRVIISGMGSSHFAGFGLWANLVKLGIPAWWVETGQLLDSADGIITDDSLIWLTSQSGESAETVAVLDRIPTSGVHVVGVTNHPDSTLGRTADTRIDLLAGEEATVSTKSYVNSLAVVRLLVGQLTGSLSEVESSLRATTVALESYLWGFEEHVAALKSFAVGRHLLMAGRGVAASSAWAAGLVIKEAAKVPVEGMTAGALRHGVVELAGPHLAVTFFDHGPGAHRTQNLRLADDLAAVGTEIAWVSSSAVGSGLLLPAPVGSDVDPLIRDALAFQTLSFELARRNGVTPGAFAVASKVTDVL